jgi:hypothetical protein
LLDLLLVVFHVPLHSGIHGLDLGLALVCHITEENPTVLVIALHFLVIFFFWGLFWGSCFFFFTLRVISTLVVSKVFIEEFQC